MAVHHGGKVGAAEKIIISVSLGMVFASLNIVHFMGLIEKYWNTSDIWRMIVGWLNNHVMEMLVGLSAMGIAAVIGIVFYEEIKRIEREWIRTFLAMVWSISLTFSVALVFLGIYVQWNTKVEAKTKYEIVIKQNEQYVVLSDKEKQLLVARYEYDEQGWTIFVNEYFFAEKYGCVYNYIDFQEPPKIVKEN